tara:strand:- start:485 stop:997 length:513 start_codon:yes stop_codon:yes gene_type:complete
MPINYGDGGTSSVGRIVQVAEDNSMSEDSGTETSWTQTGLIDLQFANNVTSGNKVLLMFSFGMGEPYNGCWAQHAAFTIYCATQGNLGNSSWGLTGGWVSGSGSANSEMQYGFMRMNGSLLYTPTTTTPRYYLYRKRISCGWSMTVGSAHHSSAHYNSGNTCLIAMEVAA